jgi:dolichyl-phosphate-mannose--protein O-mannosyl transferase
MMQKPPGVFSLQKMMTTIATGRRMAPNISLKKVGVGDVMVADCTDAHDIISAREHLELIRAEQKRLLVLQPTPDTTVVIRDQLDWVNHYLPIVHLIYQTLIHEYSPQVPFGRGDLRVNDKGHITLVIIPQGNPDQSELPVA